MKRSIVWLILALSLLFNLFFAAGFIRARAEAERPQDPDDGMTELVTRELDLNKEQREDFQRLRNSMREVGADYSDAIAYAEEELQGELAKENPDLDRVRDLVERRADVVRERRQVAAQHFSEFVGMLEPEQRRRLSRHFHGPPPDRGRGGDRDDRHRDRGQFMRRFDTNQDGKIDAGERKAAFEEFRSKARDRARSGLLEAFDADLDGVLEDDELAAVQSFVAEGQTAERWRDELLERFDANDDGELDEAERADARRAMQERRDWRERRSGDRRGGRDRDGRHRGPDRDRPGGGPPPGPPPS
jgi:Ca2+-binding EF-hand superfamily protein/Spy/CpxP family protein refolding chaperone